LNIESSQLYGGDQTPTNNTDNSDGNNGDDNNDNLLSTLSFIPHRSIDNLSPNTVSSRSQNSSLLSDIFHTNNTIEPQNNNNFVDQTTEPINHLRNELLPSVDDIMNQLTNMLDYAPLNIEQLSKSSL
jgi:hypothetical protein